MHLMTSIVTHINRYVLHLCITCLCVLTFPGTYSQNITFSELDDHDNPKMAYEIIGRFDHHYLVYKSEKRKHFICIYDESMKWVESKALDIIPDKIIDLDIVKSKDRFHIVWEEQHGCVISCYAATFNPDAALMYQPVLLDTTEISWTSEKKIYTTVYSDDKSKLLIYKRYVKKGDMVWSAKTYNNEFQQMDSIRYVAPFNKRKNYMTDAVVDNAGNIYWVIQNRNSNYQPYEELSSYIHRSGVQGFESFKLALNGKRLLQASLKVDNYHARCLVTSGFSEGTKYREDGVFLGMTDSVSANISQSDFLRYSDSIKTVLKRAGSGSSYDEADMKPLSLIVKKNGSLVLIEEDAYDETISALNPFNNGSIMGNNGMYSPYDYYYSPYQSSFYNRNFGRNNKRYNCNNINVIQIDSSLQNHWLRVISKSQYAEDDESFLSFMMMIQSKEIHFVYIGNQNQRHILTHVGIASNGDVNRYPTLRGSGNEYDFLPRYGKQTGANTFVVPYIYNNRLGFAKVEF